MFKSAWDGIHVISDSMKERVARPKNIGMTMVIDTCVGLQMLRDVLQLSNKYIDHWKCSYGVSAVMPSNILHQKLEMLNEYNINTFPGGTLLEAAIIQKNCQSYMVRAKEIGFRSAEISDGTITLPIARRRNAILCALDNGLTPITEVGKKDPLKQPSPDELAEQIPYYDLRHMVKPGISGWAQVIFPYGASTEDSLKKLQYELYYIKNQSLLLDLNIMLRTLATVFQRAGR